MYKRQGYGLAMLVELLTGGLSGGTPSKFIQTFPRDDIAKISGLTMLVNKRNWRKQEQHLKIARATRDIIHDNWREGNGRPSVSYTHLDVYKRQIQQTMTRTPVYFWRGKAYTPGRGLLLCSPMGGMTLPWR